MSRKKIDIPPGPGTRFWRSLDEAARTPQFEEMLHKEFPAAAAEWNDETSRRTFLKLMSASLALAGVSVGCSRAPDEKIVPYVRQPEQLIPGKPLYFATATTLNGFARGVLVESHEGRPTKIEGNPDHPASLGATDVFAQASILNLYDPDRSQTVMRMGEVGNWSLFIHALEPALEKFNANGGQGLRILSRTITSPTLAAQMKQFAKMYPSARWHQYDPINRDNSSDGAMIAFGSVVAPVYHFDQAKVILSLDDNFLADHPAAVRYARDFTNGRRVRSDRREMNRLYVAESTPTITGAMADHRVRVKPSAIESIARSLLTGGGDAWTKLAAKDLQANRGASLVLAGENQPPAVHALAHALNAELGNIGKTVTFIDPVEADSSNKVDSIRTLVADMNAGAVNTLIILGGNPVYDAPADLNFEAALKKFSENKNYLSVHHAAYNDETSFLTQWHLPLSHELESWSDARAYDGTATIIQPLIAPLYESRSAIEAVAALIGQRDRSAYELLREYWRGAVKPNDFESWWEKCLHDGVIPDTAAPARTVNINAQAIAAASSQPSTAPAAGHQIELTFRPDPSIFDGEFANNSWLQEVPKPLTKITWDNAALMSHATAVRLGAMDVNKEPGNKIETSLIQLTVPGGSIPAAVWILPGQPDDVITLHLGYGRTHAGRVGNKVGFNAYRLRTLTTQWFTSTVKVELLNETYAIACTQNHTMMDQHDRELIHVEPIAKPAEKSHGEKRTISLPVHKEHHEDASLYPDVPYSGNKWGMVIDQNTCIGCNACVVACISENNIPVVGKDQVAKGREMHWLRIDTYFAGETHEPEGPYFQPLPCMHCENAPCEVVCPVEASLHDAEGINNMVYNRCIGTRYCSNNCPYKVRHFNFLHYSEPIQKSHSLTLAMNPDVTVRYRGVMEKCTYCIQRINHGRIDAKKEDRDIKDGEVVTACQQSCPTQAITFGNLNDPAAAVTKLAKEPMNYSLLDEELQTRPRTTYLPRFTNSATPAAPQTEKTEKSHS